jgi:hypothetical protein
MAHEGSFQADETGKEYFYEFVHWREQGGDYRTDDPDLTKVDDLVVRITDPSNDKEYYETITGPMEDWDFVEDILEYDFGKEGSR